MMKNEVCINIKLEKSRSIDIDTREDIKTYLDL